VFSIQDAIAAHAAVYASGRHNYVGLRLSVPSGWNIRYLVDALARYEDPEVADLLRFGFPVGYCPGDRSACADGKVRTHKGAVYYPDAVNAFLDSEVSLGATLGPFDNNPLMSPLTLSPLNTVDKDNGRKRRVIVDLSWPEGSSVNDGIDKRRYLDDDIQLHYPSVDSLLDIVRDKGSGCLLFKRDLRRAYRQIPVDPGDIHLLGYSWQSRIYIDRVFPFGLRSAAYICQRVTSALTYIAREKGVSCVNYLDDFGGAESPPMALNAFETLGEVLASAGAEESIEKACPPATVMTFLGVEIDTLAMEIRVPQDKLVAIRERLPDWLHKRTCSKKELQSLIGRLAFIAKCVAPGRLFLSRLLECLRGLCRAEDTVHLSVEFCKDIRWWYDFVAVYNGISIIKRDPWLAADQIFSTDACLIGCGGVCGRKYFHAEFPSSIRERGWPIAILECLAIVVAAKLWAHDWTGKRVTVACDNMATVIVLNSGRAKHTVLLRCLRELAYLAAVHEFEYRAVHIPGVRNTAADILSRWSLLSNCESRFQRVMQCDNLVECEVPEVLFQLNAHW
jgi:hypothetical protein